MKGKLVNEMPVNADYTIVSENTHFINSYMEWSFITKDS
jgi:hypothetical protein